MVTFLPRHPGSPAVVAAPTVLPGPDPAEMNDPLDSPQGQDRPGSGPLGPGARLAWLVGTVGGVGLAPIAPGTFGSAVAVPIFVLFSPLCLPADPTGSSLGSLAGSSLGSSLAGLLILGVSWVALLALGIWAGDRLEPVFGRSDDGRIVVDEVVGQLLAYAPLLFPLPRTDFPALVTGFVLFRLFDVWKPGPVRWAERRFKGGLGVMMDDVVAGALAACVLAVLLRVVPALAGGAS